MKPSKNRTSLGNSIIVLGCIFTVWASISIVRSQRELDFIQSAKGRRVMAKLMADEFAKISAKKGKWAIDEEVVRKQISDLEKRVSDLEEAESE